MPDGLQQYVKLENRLLLLAWLNSLLGYEHNLLVELNTFVHKRNAGYATALVAIVGDTTIGDIG